MLLLATTYKRPDYEPLSPNEVQEEKNFEKCFIWGRYRRYHIVRFRGRLAYGVLSFVRGSDHWSSYRWLRWTNNETVGEDAAPHLATQQNTTPKAEHYPARIDVDAFRSYTLYSLSIIRPGP